MHLCRYISASMNIANRKLVPSERYTSYLGLSWRRLRCLDAGGFTAGFGTRGAESNSRYLSFAFLAVLQLKSIKNPNVIKKNDQAGKTNRKIIFQKNREN